MDTLRLEYEWKKAGFDLDGFCKAIGMAKTTYYRKVRGETEFTRADIERICQVLNLDSPMEIFFADRVS